MRRGSLVGPLLLIVIGGLFLLNNLRPELPLLELMARYWPFVLIGWGALRLAEILVLYARSKPLPVYGISGGEWALVILITILGSAAFFAQRHAGKWPPGRIGMRGIEIFGESYDFPLEGRQAAGKTPRVFVENLRGNVRVVGGDTEEVTVAGRKTIRAFHQDDANTANQQSPLEISLQNGRVTVRTRQERVSGEQRVSADLEITVPRGASFEGRGRYGDFDISGIQGSIELDSDNAGVRLHEVGGAARIHLRRSNIVRAVNLKGPLELKGGGQDVELENVGGQVTITGSYSGDLQFRNLAMPLQFQSGRTELRVAAIPGQLRMALGNVTAENVAGPVRLKTRSKDVRIVDFTGSLEISLERGDVEVQPVKLPLGRMQIETGSGNVGLLLPPAAAFKIKALARRGDIANEWGEPLKKSGPGENDKDRGASLEGTVAAGPPVEVSTGRGTITIRKSSDAGRRTAAPRTPEPAEKPEDPRAPSPALPLRVQEY